MNIIIHLGGTWRRAEAAAKLANSLEEDYIIVVSSEGREDKFRAIYREAGIPDEKVIHDTAAWDTVTNFTHTYKLLRKLGITKLYVVTSDFHMERAMVVFLSRVYLGRLNNPTEWTSMSLTTGGVLEFGVYSVFLYTGRALLLTETNKTN